MERFDMVVIGAGSAGAVLAARRSEDPDVGAAARSGPRSPRRRRARQACGHRTSSTRRWNRAGCGPTSSRPAPAGSADVLRRGAGSRRFVVGQRDGRDPRHRRRLRAVGGRVRLRGLGLARDARAVPRRRGRRRLRRRRPPRARRTDSTRSRAARGAAAARRALRAAIDVASATRRATTTTRPARPGSVGARSTLRDGHRVSTNDAYLEPARERPNLTVRGDALVDRVVLDGRRAVGVRTRERRGNRAREVIVSAGAIHSPAILLRSGIGVGDGLAGRREPQGARRDARLRARAA